MTGELISTTALIGTPAGCYYDGKYLYWADIAFDFVYQVDPRTGNLLRIIPHPAGAVILFSEGKNFIMTGLVNYPLVYTDKDGTIIASLPNLGIWDIAVTYMDKYIGGVTLAGANYRIYSKDYTIVYNGVPYGAIFGLGCWADKYIFGGDLTNANLTINNPRVTDLIKVFPIAGAIAGDISSTAFDGKNMYGVSGANAVLYYVNWS